MRLEILMTAVLFYGLAFLMGYAVRRLLKLKNEGILFSVLSGVMCMWALMELVLVPMTMKFASFTGFVYVWTAVAAVAAAAGLFCRKDILEDVRAFVSDWKSFITPGHLAALALIIYQLWFLHHHMYLEWDDTYYVNLANEAVHSDKIYWVYPETGAFADFDKRYVLSLWPVFYAWLSKLTGALPTIMAHTILPWIIIPLSYMVYEKIGELLFQDDRKMQGMFLTFAVLMHLFMSGIHTSGLTFLSITPWVGKGVLATVLIPMLFYGMLRTGKDGSAGNWILLGITGLAGCLLSSMGIMLAPVFVGTAAVLSAAAKKNWKILLYGMLACVPCIILGCYYIYLTH